MQRKVQRQDRRAEDRIAAGECGKNEIPIRARRHEKHHQPDLHIDALTKEKASQHIGKDGRPKEIDGSSGRCEANIPKRCAQLPAVDGEKDEIEQCNQRGLDQMSGNRAENRHASEAEPRKSRRNDEQRLR